MYQRCWDELYVFCELSKYWRQTFQPKDFGYFPKGYRTQYYFSAMLQKKKIAVNKGKSFRHLLANLSKAFPCLPQRLVLPKLHAYVFCFGSLVISHFNMQTSLCNEGN